MSSRPMKLGCVLSMAISLVVGGCGDQAHAPTAPPPAQPALPAPSPEPPALVATTPTLVRLLIGSDHARRIASFLTEQDGPNCSCTTAGGETTCGQVIDVAGNATGLVDAEAPERLARAETVLLSEESNDGKPMLRVRIQGPAATTIAQHMNYEMAARPGGVITGANHSCVVSDEREITCGFIVDRDGRTFHLESFGYD